MLEALAAVSLAGNVIQLVQFSSDLIKQTVEIRRSGTSPPLSEIRHITISSLQQTHAIKHQFSPRGGQQQSQEDQALFNVAVDCHNLGSELQDHVDTLLQIPAHPSRWQSARQSIKIKFQQQKLDLFVERIESLRQALSFQVVLALQTSMGKNHTTTNTKLDSLQKDMQSIIVQLQGYPAFDDQRLTDAINRCLEAFWQKQDKARPIFDPDVFGPFPQAGNTNWYHDNHGEARKANRGRQREKVILKMLRFRQMTDRFEEISPAHRLTLDWIFQPPPQGYPWDSFVDFLQNNSNEPYWVCGKAGSGKSTLIKFILDHPLTKDGLKLWAGAKELIIAPFFFWNLGTPLQKSHSGLLRSLLHTILGKHPELIQEAFPELWNDWRATDEEHDFSLVELKGAFLRLLAIPSDDFKMCLVIDGVDEFEGNHEDISVFLRGLSSPRLKLVISSRPIPSCVSTFQKCPKLRLQDLTKNDIDFYIHDNLDQDSNMVQLQQMNPKDALKLIEEIRLKADGVFLWVKLVIRLLIQEMRSTDKISDLQLRLRALPAELEGLYKQMLGKMDSIHQIQAAEIFQIIRAWVDARPKDPLSTLMLSYANQDSGPYINMEPAPLEGTEALRICKQTETRLRSRCCGLLEVHEKIISGVPDNEYRRQALHHGALKDSVEISSQDILILGSTVQYLHRSVAEFLYTKSNWEETKRMTSASSFDPYVCLTNACLFMLKIQPPTPRAKGSVWSCLDKFISCCRVMDGGTDQLHLSIINVLDTTMTYFHSNYHSGSNFHWSSTMPLTTTGRFGEKAVDMHLQEASNILTFAIRNGLHRYVNLRLREEDAELLYSSQSFISYALDSWFNSEWKPPLHARIKTLQSIFDYSTKSTSSVVGNSYWELSMNLALKFYADEFLPDCGELVKILLLIKSNGTDLPFQRPILARSADIAYLFKKLKRYSAPSDKPNKNTYPEDATSIELDEESIRDLGFELENMWAGIVDSIEQNSSRLNTPLNAAYPQLPATYQYPQSWSAPMNGCIPVQSMPVQNRYHHPNQTRAPNALPLNSYSGMPPNANYIQQPPLHGFVGSSQNFPSNQNLGWIQHPQHFQSRPPSAFPGLRSNYQHYYNLPKNPRNFY